MLRGDNPPMGPVNPPKTRTGLNRVWHALGYSLEGLRAGWGETAFRQEAIAAVVLLPLRSGWAAAGSKPPCWPARC
jgi:diacylglycerol kinase (ATP)